MAIALLDQDYYFNPVDDMVDLDLLHAILTQLALVDWIGTDGEGLMAFFLFLLQLCFFCLWQSGHSLSVKIK